VIGKKVRPLVRYETVRGKAGLYENLIYPEIIELV